MAAKATLLVHFVSDFLRDEQLQRKVIRNPSSALRAYGLTTRHIATLRTANADKIANVIARELESVGPKSVWKNASA